jgi:Holliday junction resolvasome RuvABC endonuclease subunit
MEIECTEVAPQSWKKGVTGNGKAEKEEVRTTLECAIGPLAMVHGGFAFACDHMC